MRTTVSISRRNAADGRYGAVASGLHWLVLALLIVQFAVAWTMPNIRRGTPDTGLIAWHLSLGTTILAVMLLRLAWRLTHTPPPPPADLPAPLRLLSRAVQWLLYAILIALPVLGWINASARGYVVRLFAAIPLPQLVATGNKFGQAMGDLHGTVALVLLGVIGLHVLGALYHTLILRDGLLRRLAVD